jgi:hypothetical protein
MNRSDCDTLIRRGLKFRDLRQFIADDRARATPEALGRPSTVNGGLTHEHALDILERGIATRPDGDPVNPSSNSWLVVGAFGLWAIVAIWSVL